MYKNIRIQSDICLPRDRLSCKFLFNESSELYPAKIFQGWTQRSPVDQSNVQPIFIAISVASCPALPLRAPLAPSRAREIAGEIRKFARYPMNSNRPSTFSESTWVEVYCRIRVNKSEVKIYFLSKYIFV